MSPTSEDTSGKRSDVARDVISGAFAVRELPPFCGNSSHCIALRLSATAPAAAAETEGDGVMADIDGDGCARKLPATTWDRRRSRLAWLTCTLTELDRAGSDLALPVTQV